LANCKSKANYSKQLEYQSAMMVYICLATTPER